MISVNAIGPAPIRCAMYDAIYPRQYIAYRAPICVDHGDGKSTCQTSKPSPAIDINGDLSKTFWEDVPWTEDFVDISTETTPKFRTRVKMRWDDDFFYVGAMMEESDVWGTLTEHNSVIFHDNDFEVFIDTNGSNHNYKEFEINALGTTWVLLLNKPYADNGCENSKRVKSNGFDMQPLLKSAVLVHPDAINQSNTPNTHWTVEIAFPIYKLTEHCLHAQNPAEGVFWRINFSRVQWGVKVNANGQYEKVPCCQSCATPGAAVEDNWVWSKQGEVAMHLPERWGIVQFSTKPPCQKEMIYYDQWPCRCAAMALYYALKGYFTKEGKYTDNIEVLKKFTKDSFPICAEADMTVTLTDDGFEAEATVSSCSMSVNQDRLLVEVMKSAIV